MAINLIRKNNQSEVTAYHDSVIFHSIKGKNGIFQYVGTGFSTVFNNTTKVFTINSGMGMLYGRQFEVVEGGEINFNWSALSPPKYISIYLEIDLRNPTLETAEFKALYDNTTYPVITAGDNLIAIKQGVARMEMFRVYLTSSGVTKTNRYGIISNQSILNADYAISAEDAMYADDSYSVGGNIINHSDETLKVKLFNTNTYHALPVIKVVYDGVIDLHNTNNIGTTIALTEIISVGDILEFIYLPCYNLSSTGYNVFAKAYVRVTDLRITATTAIGTDTVPSYIGYKMIFSSNRFTYAGNILTFQGGYILRPQFVDGTYYGDDPFGTYTSDTIRIVRIIKIAGGRGV